ncbi:hypothetical protein ACIO6U_02990 [Streptomyces sp. NPDC087422]|uniref:3'-5' exonuclease n=1 Tax=Streptomyces sp. NPDC087422 TaxID=3365786 RepID=UPI0038107591
MSTTAPLAFVDTETTHLSAEIGEIWELAVILRDLGGTENEHVWQFAPRTLDADIHGEAMRVGRFHERFAVPDGCTAAYITGGDIDPMTRADAIKEVTEILRGAVLVGSNAAFDDRHLRKLLDLRGEQQPWHYRPVCVATLAAGFLYGHAERMTKRDCDASWYAKVADRLGWPWKSYNASEATGVPRPADDVAHTALGDAKWARDLYDRITVPDAFYTATDDQLAQMAGEALSRANGGQLANGE